MQVSHSNYDTHNENFNFHHEQLGEFDLPFATLINDLADRGMLDSTLVVVLSEFGPYAEDQSALRPGSLGNGLVGLPWRLWYSGRCSLWQDER